MISLSTDINDLILQRTLYDNTFGLNSAIERMTTGFKINHARDNAANYSITTDLSKKISSMLMVQQNTEDGMAMLQTAEGGLAEIQEKLERLRELSMQAATGTYDSVSREAMQEEADAIIAEIERIKKSTQYNGMNLYETKKEDTTVVSKLAKSAKIKNINDNIISLSDGEDMSSSPSDLSLSSNIPTVSKSKAAIRAAAALQAMAASASGVSGAENFAANETKIITIDGVKYTVKNNLSVANSLSYSKDSATGELTFLGSSLDIRGQVDVAHNVIINGSRVYFYGGDLDDTIQSAYSSTQNYLYGLGGKDTMIAMGSNTHIYGGDGDDIITQKDHSGGSFFGDSGNDTITINTLAADVYGGDGNDIFYVNAGITGRFCGDGGDDTFYLRTSGLIVDGGSGTNRVLEGAENNTTINVVGANAFGVEFNVGETKTLNINGIDYEITNRNVKRMFIYSIEDDGQIVFKSTYFDIKGDKNKAHNVYLSVGQINFWGGNLSDNISYKGQNNHIYASGGDNILTQMGGANNTIINVGDGNNDITIKFGSTSLFAGNGNNKVHISGTAWGMDLNFGNGNNTISGNKLSESSIRFGTGTNTIENNTANMIVNGLNPDELTQSIILNGTETKVIKINNIEYKVTNNLADSHALVYSYNPVTGKVSFGGSYFSIVGAADSSHDVDIYGHDIRFYGGNLDDNIVAYGDYVYVYGKDGDDTITLNGLYDQAYGGNGNDTIYSNNDAYGIYGEAGDDTIYINHVSSYQVEGGAGSDTYHINAKAQRITDNEGNNIFNVNTNNVIITGGSGNDTFYVKGSNNTILGAGGDDYIVIDGSNNTIDGGTGNNIYVDNGAGNTKTNIVSDPNSGVLNFTRSGEVKSFTINGKTYTVTNNLNGVNTLQYSLNTNTGVITLNGSNFTCGANASEQAVLNIRGDNNIINGSDLADRITIEQGSGNVVNGGLGNDTLVMNSENNSLLGGDGNDTITLSASTNRKVDGEGGDDTIIINSDNNTNVLGGLGDDRITVNGKNNTIKSGEGNNTITINNSNNNINAGDGDNRLVVNGSENTVVAGSGENSIGIQGDNNNITAQNASGNINIIGNDNIVSNISGNNNVIIKGDLNRYTSNTGQKDVTITGANNNIITGSGNDSFNVKGASNTLESTSGNNKFTIKGDSNTIQGGAGIDEIKLSGSNNSANGGEANDSFVVSLGSDNNIDGEGGSRNTVINNGINTTFSNAVDVTPNPLETRFKVDIGSGADKFISTIISFNLFDFSVDLLSSEGALESLDKIDDMIKTVQTQILNIGTSINRLETVLEAQNVKLENLISTRSTLRDTDVAQESSHFIRSQILQQASATLMASSRNLKAQNVLGLIQGLNG